MAKDLERIESVKAGGMGAIAFTGAYLTAMVVRYHIIGEDVTGMAVIIKIAIALLNGFLFGVTYRYLVRTDDNAHLRDGAVLAFSLVRGLVPLEISSNFSENWLILALLSGESLICFAFARLTLDFAFNRRWIEPLS